MKTIILIRHAKSSWKNMSLKDDERPLKRRGKDDCVLVAQQLLLNNFIPEHCVSSPAKRAMNTAERINKAMKNACSVDIDESLYFSRAEAYLEAINNQDNKYSVIALFGHNPDITAAGKLLGAIEEPYFTTCGFMVFTSTEAAWKNINKESLNFVFFGTPRMIKENDSKPFLI